MKKVLLIASLFWMVSSVSAVTYCASAPWGYGKSATGGGNATPTLVKSESEFKNALKSSNKVIIITQNITISDQISTDKGNLTIMALPEKRLISNSQTKDQSGILYLKGSNIILRNITFEGPGAYDCDGKDLLTLDGAKNVWVDHCDFQDGMDGNFDIKGLSDNISVTWCRFRYLKTPKAGGSGGADDHRFSNLVGSSSSDKPSDGTYNITYGYCWWDEGCKQRMTRCRNCELHFLNCYWNSSVADYYVGPENAKCYFEGCTFAGKANSAKNIYKGFNNTTNYCKFVNCTGNCPSDKGNVAAPTYSYDQLAAATAKTYVTLSSCGAGATLSVTNEGVVSSSCDSGEGGGEGGGQGGGQGGEGGEGVVSDFWNFSDSDFNGLGEITAETVVRDLHIVASSSAKITIDQSAKAIDGINFTHRLKFGGAGNETARHLWFDVTGDCSITVYLTSSSGTGDARTLNISTGSFNNVVSTMSAPAGSVNKDTYNYTGPATRIYLYSAASGINLYGVKLTSQGSETANKEVVFSDKQQARKIIREGRLLILRDNKTFDITGRRVD